MSDNEQEAIKRCHYASQLLTEAKIDHQIKKESIGHINLLYKGKCVMSFWARTGKFIFTKSPSSPIKTRDDRGIKNCIDAYKQLIDGIERTYEN